MPLQKQGHSHQNLSGQVEITGLNLCSYVIFLLVLCKAQSACKAC